MNSRFAWNPVLLLALTCLIWGCRDESAPPAATGTQTPSSPAKTVVTSDDEASVAALTEAGFILTKNAAGVVTECSMNTNEDISATLAHLSGLHSLQNLRHGRADWIRQPEATGTQ